MLIFDFTPMNVKDFPKIENEIANMPSYPAKGSIRYVNGIAVIKLGSELRSDQRRIYRPYSKRLQFFLSSRHDHGIEKIPDGSSNIEETIWTLSKANANVSMRCVRKADFGAAGTLKLQIHGNDPILTLKNLPKARDVSDSFCLSLKFTANAQEKLQVFFKRRRAPNSKEFELGHFVVPMLKGDNLVQVAFPKEILDGGLLRIDPGSGKATEVLFEEIAIKNMKQKQ